MWRKNIGFLAAALAIGVLFVVFGEHSASSSGYQASGHDAYKACEQWVTQRLKAPSTADFSGANHSQISETNSGYDVHGFVDSQNSFGAKIRADWSCSTHLADDSWVLDDLQIS